MISLPKAVFFDWDGTLVDSYAFLEGAHNSVRMQLGLPSFREHEFEHYFGKPREELYKAIYAPHEAKAKGLFEAYVRENHLKLLAMEGAGELLEALHRLNIPCGVVSNKKPEFIAAEIKHFGWSDYFVSYIGAGEAKADKPAPDPLWLALQKAHLEGFEPKDIWFVGDTDNDLLCAKGAGCPAVLLGHLPETPRWVAEYKPFLVVKDCRELHQLVLQTAGK